MKIIDHMFGMMTDALERPTCTRYQSYRAQYLNIPGLIIVYKDDWSQRRLVYFMPRDQHPVVLSGEIISAVPAYIHTSFGEITQDDERRLVIETKKSIYEFEKGDFDLGDLEKELLLWFAGLGDMPVLTKEQQRMLTRGQHEFLRERKQ